ncbi:hypothetical protein EUTSA_v10021686mg [Eutrema salsugineum]|uniref:Uncharacterized protein n=1 Tax=Eutrema salsugineum TaxID=72664 RepID=V4NTA0_EUTSA|nr:hypothetical protein EUTSA_v10021686mg [Eutrema salsugineum]
MTTLQRSAVSFRRQGSSGRIWSDQFILDPTNEAIFQNKEQTNQQSRRNSNDPEDNIQIQKSSSSFSSSPPPYFSEKKVKTSNPKCKSFSAFFFSIFENSPRPCSNSFEIRCLLHSLASVRSSSRLLSSQFIFSLACKPNNLEFRRNFICICSMYDCR